MDAPLELVCKLDLVEEDPRVMVLVIETILELPDALDRAIDLLVPTEYHEGGVGLPELWVEGWFDVNHRYRFVFMFVLAVE